MIKCKTKRGFWLLAGALLFSMCTLADDGKADDGKVEVAGFGGVLALSGGGGTHGLAGGSSAVRVAGHLRVFGEFTYSQLDSETASQGGVSATLKDKLYSFGGGVDYSFGSSKRFVPYVLGAVGDGRESLGASASAGGESASVNILSSNMVYVGVGGGLRIYAGDHWGVKPEFRYQRYTGSSGGSSGIVTFGIFYQFGK